jgi:polyadenylate-binding protein 2
MSGESDFAALLARLNAEKKKRLEEAAKAQAEKDAATAAAAESATDQKPPCDENSIFVNGLEYSVRKEDLTEFFQNCGQIIRVTVPTDQYTRKPRGHAYIEFADLEAVENALKFDGHLFKNRNIQVLRKRTNLPAPPRRRRFRRH